MGLGALQIVQSWWLWFHGGPLMVPWWRLLALCVSGSSLAAILATCAGERTICAQASVLRPPDSAYYFLLME